MPIAAAKLGLSIHDIRMRRDVFMTELHFKKCAIPLVRNTRRQPYDDAPTAELREHDQLRQKIYDNSKRRVNSY